VDEEWGCSSVRWMKKAVSPILGDQMRPGVLGNERHERSLAHIIPAAPCGIKFFQLIEKLA